MSYGGQALDGYSARFAAATPPRLWNPSAASGWSLFVSPVFGSILHAKNWTALERPDRARANTIWAVIGVAFYLASGIVLARLAGSQPAVTGLAGLVGIALLAAWYFSEGRGQAEYLRTTLGDGYPRRSIGLALVVALACFGVYLAVCVGIAQSLGASAVASLTGPAPIEFGDSYTAAAGDFVIQNPRTDFATGQQLAWVARLPGPVNSTRSERILSSVSADSTTEHVVERVSQDIADPAFSNFAGPIHPLAEAGEYKLRMVVGDRVLAEGRFRLQ